jgi:hypothetical protein
MEPPNDRPGGRNGLIIVSRRTARQDTVLRITQHEASGICTVIELDDRSAYSSGAEPHRSTLLYSLLPRPKGWAGLAGYFRTRRRAGRLFVRRDQFSGDWDPAA